MIDFTTLQGLTIPEGVVTQITDASGNVIWAVANDKPIVLEVKKITSYTYAGETTYTGESFILLDIYPKNASSTVKVTYGGLTKTLTFSGTNAQQVYFGTFNGVADEVETPASGTLTIEGGCRGFGCGTYSSGNKTTGRICSCITKISDWGSGSIDIPDKAFYGCNKLRSEGLIVLPSTIRTFYLSAIADEDSVDDGDTIYLEWLAILATTPPTYYDGSINLLDSHLEAISVPTGCIEAYKVADGWSDYADIMIELIEENYIAFTVDGVAYRAKFGMTWKEWVNSSYNTSGFVLSDDGYIRTSLTGPILYVTYNFGAKVLSNYIITPYIEYYTT